jgi:hypothetical protein
MKRGSYRKRAAIISFILKFCEVCFPIGILRDILNVESQNPLVVFTSLRLERVYGLERENSSCMESMSDVRPSIDYNRELAPEM